MKNMYLEKEQTFDLDEGICWKCRKEKESHDIKIIAFYLPQFHSFPENDKWWGKGFTEWTNTKKAKPLFDGHYQPHIPYKHDYYNLLDESVMRRQIEEAKSYGIYGFCFYHYWFTKGKRLMERPVESFLNDKSLDIHFCLSWANEPWTRKWNGGIKDVIMPQEYGDQEDWKLHFMYMLPFFRDKRYIYKNGMPMLIIYRPEIIPQFNEMMDCWQQMARENGLQGLFIMAQGTQYCAGNHKKFDSRLDGYIMYEPGYTLALLQQKNPVRFIKNIIHYWGLAVQYLPRKFVQIFYRKIKVTPKKPLNVCDFSVIWNSILKHKPSAKYYPGAFANWDNTARRGIDARIITNSTPELFKKFFYGQLKRTKEIYKKEYLFFTAWNEWAEGSHLEADEKYGYQYLEAVREALCQIKQG